MKTSSVPWYGCSQLGTTSWQSLLPNRYGEATVTVRLENEDGDLLLGQRISTRVRSGTKKRRQLRRTGVVVGATLGVLGVVASSHPPSQSIAVFVSRSLPREP